MINLSALKTVSQDDVRKLIVSANNYYNGRHTGMTDYEYDTIYNSIKLEVPSFNIFDYVHFEVDLVRQNHLVHLPNFEKVNYDRLAGELTDDLVLTPKYDGCSIVAYYLDGSLQGIMTRSDETTGVVQTNKLRWKVPQKVDSRIRAILFEALTIEHRAAANGLINSKYKQDEVDRDIYLRPFDCILNDKQMGYIDRMDLTGLDYTKLTLEEAESLGKQGDEPKLYVSAIGKEVPVDGVVVYSKTNPVFGRIYKFYGTDAKSSVVTKLHFDPSSDTGIVSITAEFEPIRIGSIRVKRCGNVGTWKSVKEKKLGIGSRVKVTLTKVTIPYIKENTPWTEEPVPTCPWCGERLTEFQGKLICMNEECGFWFDFFANRYFTLLRELKGSEWVDEFTVKGPYGLDTIHRAEEVTNLKFSKLMTVPRFALFVLKPPRLTGKAYDEVYESVMTRIRTSNTKDTFGLAQCVRDSLKTDNQKEYFDIVWKKLIYTFKRLSELRRN